MMSTRIHAAAGITAMAMVTVFWTSTVGSELSGDPELIAGVKRAILWGLLVLVPSMAASGATGFRLARGWDDPLIRRKVTRMKFVAANGLLVLVPCAVALAMRASRAQFDATFYVVQTIELAAGLTQLVLLGLNARDGLRLSGRVPAAAV
jgi:hypothetical protein